MFVKQSSNICRLSDSIPSKSNKYYLCACTKHVKTPFLKSETWIYFPTVLISLITICHGT